METCEIRGNKKIVSYLTLFTDILSKDIVEHVLKNIEFDHEIGFAGFRNKDGLRTHLEWEISGTADIEKIDNKIVKTLIEKTVKKCLSAASSGNPIHIFVLPTFNDFVKEKMNGVTGYSPWKNTVLIYINPISGWKNELIDTVCHEIAHAIAQNYNPMTTILDQIVFDGLAEHFRDFVTGGERTPLTSAFTEIEAKKILHEIMGEIESDNNAARREIFYGEGKYPLWAGYAIGYYVVRDFLKQEKKINWNSILKIPPKKIFKQSKFIVI